MDVYTCRQYNGASDKASDIYFVEQYAQLDPSASYKNSPYTSKYAAQQYGYIVRYDFDNTPATAEGKDITSGITLKDSSPLNTVGSTSTSSGFSASIGGNVGISATGPSGGLNAGISYSSSTSVSTSDTVVQARSNPTNGTTAWTYSFSRPVCHGGPYFCAGGDFYDAPLNSRALFQPANKWYWQTSERNKLGGFNIKFHWIVGNSYGDGYAWWIKVRSVEHKNLSERTSTVFVPIGIQPPLIAANGMSFSRAGETKDFPIGTASSTWHAKVSSGSDWCKLIKGSGTGQVEISGSRDETDSVHVEVDDNASGVSREAVVELWTNENEAHYKVKIFQAR